MGKIVVDENACKGCALCVNACPLHLIRISQRINIKGYYPAEFIDTGGKCTGCTLCAITCPDVAIEVYREKKGSGEKK
ncbi:MAG: ferredoxin family protein [Candidatus Bathyarchaeia archaeon]